MGKALENAKDGLRREMRRARLALPPAEAERLASAGCARLLALPSFAAARHLVLYVARAGEVDTAALAHAASRAGKRVHYPDTPRGGFAAEDRANQSELPGAGRDVLIVVPGLAFDLQGARLGRGGGWYDQALARYPQAIRVGLAYDFQVVSRLPEDPWDLRMHAVVTDARLIDGATTSVGQ